jgi:Trk-type K+ transport system membrane component
VSPQAISFLGWIATALFVASYFFSRPLALRTTQMVAALLWIVYGALIHAPPVIVANALVATAAGWTLGMQHFRGRTGRIPSS